MSKFVPEDWELTDKLRQFARDKGLTEKQIDDEEEKFRDHQYKRSMHRWDACWRNWIRNAIKFGDVVPVGTPQYRRPETVTEAQRKKDIIDFERRLKELGK